MSDLADLADYIAAKGGHDLHDTDLGEIVVPGWEGFPVRHYRYRKTDPDGQTKYGEVALLDASPAQIAGWVHSATVQILGSYKSAKAKNLVDECHAQSGFQFPVRGIHWENMSAVFEAYTFFDGVTVRLEGWNPSWPSEPLSQDKLDHAINATWNDVAEARKYARIQSTTREHYAANGGTSPTAGKEWLNVVRTCYQAAWNSDHNELMTARARQFFK